MSSAPVWQGAGTGVGRLQVPATTLASDEGTNSLGIAVIRAFVHDFPWFHRWIGLVGNTMFVLGSVFFLFDNLVIPGTWIFVGASFGLMVDSIGEKLARYEEDRRRREGAATAAPH